MVVVASGYYLKKEKIGGFSIKGLGYESARLSISDFDNFSRFYETGGSLSCWTRVTGEDFRNFDLDLGSRQMKKLFYVHRQIAFSDQ